MTWIPIYMFLNLTINFQTYSCSQYKISQSEPNMIRLSYLILHFVYCQTYITQAIYISYLTVQSEKLTSHILIF